MRKFGINSQQQQKKRFTIGIKESIDYLYPYMLLKLLLREGRAGLRGKRAEKQRRVQWRKECRVGARAHPPLSHPEIHGKQSDAEHTGICKAGKETQQFIVSFTLYSLHPKVDRNNDDINHIGNRTLVSTAPPSFQ